MQSRDTDKNALHLITAFATETRLVLAQTAVGEKTNEITAIPDLLDWLDCNGVLITIDAMGCQKNIASKIRAKEGDYLLALKQNYPEMYTQVEVYFNDPDLKKHCDSFKSLDGEQGRIETRERFVCKDIDWLYGRSEWKGIRTIVAIESRREAKGDEQTERRFYLSSSEGSAEELLLATRSHWGIESAPQAHKGVRDELTLCA